MDDLGCPSAPIQLRGVAVSKADKTDSGGPGKPGRAKRRSAKGAVRDPFLVSLGRRVRGMREARESTALTLAGLCNMPPSSLSEIEKGRRNVTVLTLRRLAEASGFEVEIRFIPKSG